MTTSSSSTSSKPPSATPTVKTSRESSPYVQPRSTGAFLPISKKLRLLFSIIIAYFIKIHYLRKILSTSAPKSACTHRHEEPLKRAPSSMTAKQQALYALMQDHRYSHGLCVTALRLLDGKPSAIDDAILYIDDHHPTEAEMIAQLASLCSRG